MKKLNLLCLEITRKINKSEKHIPPYLLKHYKAIESIKCGKEYVVYETILNKGNFINSRNLIVTKTIKEAVNYLSNNF